MGVGREEYDGVIRTGHDGVSGACKVWQDEYDKVGWG